MGFINKEKVLRGVGKAVDVTNNAADKVTDYVKENELDKKAKSMADEFGDAMKSVGKSLEDTFSKLFPTDFIASPNANRMIDKIINTKFTIIQSKYY